MSQYPLPLSQCQTLPAALLWLDSAGPGLWEAPRLSDSGHLCHNQGMLLPDRGWEGDLGPHGLGTYLEGWAGRG